MNILLLGSGGREHAMAWKLSQSKNCTKLFIAPGNAGTLRHGQNININPLDFIAVGEFCLKEQIDMLIVGPEEPLVKGIVNHFQSNIELAHILIPSPDKAGAQLEGSKNFSKEFMKRCQIPTAAYRTFDSATLSEGINYLNDHSLPVVLKADGLAAGKGVLICEEIENARSELQAMISSGKFGEAGSSVVIEEFLSGIELSVFVLSDGKNYKILPSAKDYKRIFDGDQGPNTGGMGAVSPVPFADDEFIQKVEKRIVIPTMNGLRTEGIDYKGFIFIGLMNVEGDPYVIEYNCRMGDPETEVVFPRIKTDLVELFRATAEGKLDQLHLEIDPRTAVTIMLVSEGYPGDYAKGKTITLNADSTQSLIFHAGTKKVNDEIQTNGGRVIAVTSFGNSVSDAVSQSLETAGKINYEGKYFRRDIGYEFI